MFTQGTFWRWYCLGWKLLVCLQMPCVTYSHYVSIACMMTRYEWWLNSYITREMYKRIRINCHRSPNKSGKVQVCLVCANRGSSYKMETVTSRVISGDLHPFKPGEITPVLPHLLIYKAICTVISISPHVENTWQGPPCIGKGWFSSFPYPGSSKV